MLTTCLGQWIQSFRIRNTHLFLLPLLSEEQFNEFLTSFLRGGLQQLRLARIVILNVVGLEGVFKRSRASIVASRTIIDRGGGFLIILGIHNHHRRWVCCVNCFRLLRIGVGTTLWCCTIESHDLLPSMAPVRSSSVNGSSTDNSWFSSWKQTWRCSWCCCCFRLDVFFLRAMMMMMMILVVRLLCDSCVVAVE